MNILAVHTVKRKETRHVHVVFQDTCNYTESPFPASLNINAVYSIIHVYSARDKY